MDFSRPGRGELVAALGGLLLAGCLFLAWYETDPDNAIALQTGYFGALAGTVLMIAGGAMSAGRSDRRRNPPGVM